MVSSKEIKEFKSENRDKGHLQNTSKSMRNKMNIIYYIFFKERALTPNTRNANDDYLRKTYTYYGQYKEPFKQNQN